MSDLHYASPDTPRPPDPYLGVSWLTCLAASVFCGGVAAYLPQDRDRYARAFSEFRLKLPALTQLAIDLPAAVIWAGGLATVLLFLALQFLRISKRRLILLHLFTIAGWCVIATVYHRAMSEAFMNLSMSMSGGSAGGRP